MLRRSLTLPSTARPSSLTQPARGIAALKGGVTGTRLCWAGAALLPQRGHQYTFLPGGQAQLWNCEAGCGRAWGGSAPARAAARAFANIRNFPNFRNFWNIQNFANIRNIANVGKFGNIKVRAPWNIANIRELREHSAALPLEDRSNALGVQ